MGEPRRWRACSLQLARLTMQTTGVETVRGYEYPLAAQRNLILGSLLALAGAAWAVLVIQAAAADDDEMGLRMDMGLGLFMAIWVVMMVAMMFPTAAPVILAFGRIQANKRAREAPYVPTAVFVLAYLVVWSLAGVAAFVVAGWAESLAADRAWFDDNAARLGAGLLVLAGVYQLSPLKRVCLSRCRTPLSFILSYWKPGYRGALTLGLRHGAYCMGCCWMLFAILFPLGIMNVAAMAVITAAIFAEKSLVTGRRASFAVAGVLVLYGLAVLISPSLLPTHMASTGSGGDMEAMEGM